MTEKNELHFHAVNVGAGMWVNEGTPTMSFVLYTMLNVCAMQAM